MRAKVTKAKASATHGSLVLAWRIAEALEIVVGESPLVRV